MLIELVFLNHDKTLAVKLAPKVGLEALKITYGMIVDWKAWGSNLRPNKNTCYMVKHISGSCKNSTGFRDRFLGPNSVKNLEVIFFWYNYWLKIFFEIWCLYSVCMLLKSHSIAKKLFKKFVLWKIKSDFWTLKIFGLLQTSKFWITS